MFKKYNSIENSYQTDFLDRIKGHGFWDDEYIVQEKVHGSNLCFWTTDGLNFIAAKRTENIAVDELFYNHDRILGEHQEQFVSIWKTLKTQIDDLEQMSIFGEIIGGDYPHPDITPDKQAIMVQKGIYYSPSNHFYAFDILINNERYLDVDVVNDLFEQEHLLHARTLFRGNITDCLDYPNNAQSVIPEQLLLPPLEHNICEGVVIRPTQTRYFNNGTRVILKNKNETWSENRQFYKSINKSEPLSDQVLKLQEAIQTYVTDNRLSNVLSKIGPVTASEFGKVLGMFSKDIVNDFTKDYREIIDNLDKKEVKAITKSIGKEAGNLVKSRLNN